MPFQLRADAVQALRDWQAGKPLRTVELGHTHTTEEHPGLSSRITGIHIARNQIRAYEYCFRLLARYMMGEYELDHDQFLQVCAEMNFPNLTPEEKTGAESLAWKTLVVGWRKAIDGHKDLDYIEVQRPEGSEQ